MRPKCSRSGKHVVLPRQERAARVDQVDAWQPVLERDFLRAQVLAHGDRVIGAALDRRVVADDDAFEAGHAADARDEAAAGNPVVVQVVAGQLADLEERRARVEQPVDAVAHQQLVAAFVLRAGGSRTACAHLGGEIAQFAASARLTASLAANSAAVPIDAGLRARSFSVSLGAAARSAASSAARMRSACFTCGRSIILPSSATAPLPGAHRRGSITRRAHATSSAVGRTRRGSAQSAPGESRACRRIRPGARPARGARRQRRHGTRCRSCR